MGFSFKLAPGVRIRASSRGIRTSVGPRAARLHFGGGRAPGVSTGAGPFSLYSSLGPGRRARRSSGPTIAARQRQLTNAAKAAEAQELIAAFQAILALHQVEPEPVAQPIAPSPAPVNEAEIRRRHV
jgi:hypothetical protein